MYKIKLSPYHKIFYNEWKIHPNSYKYNILFDQTVSSTLDIIKLEDAFNRFISEYLLFNSHIVEIDNELYWVKNANINNLEYLGVEEYNVKKIYNYIINPFSLEDGPLYRFGVFKNKAGEYRLIIVLHHIIMDGSSVNKFINLISQYYNDSSYKNPVGINAQAAIITSNSFKLTNDIELHVAKCKEFWRNIFEEVEAVDLRFLRKNNTGNTYNEKENPNTIREVNFNISKEDASRLSRIARKYGVTAYMYSQAIFAMLLYRYTDQTKIAISYPLAISGTAPLIGGVQINTSVIVYNFTQIKTIVDLFNYAKAYIKNLKHGDIKYSHYPVYKIVENTSEKLLEVIFGQTNLKNLQFTFDDTETLTINNEFNVDLPAKLVFEQEYKDQQLNYRVKYDISQVDEVILHNFITHYKILFYNILVDLEQGSTYKLLSTYPILGEIEYNKIVYEWNQTTQEYPSDKTIHELFEEQVAKNPNNIALVYENIQLTYDELNRRANQLAHYLQKKCSITPDNLVAICGNCYENTFVSILGILKTGAAYIFVDSALPTDRIGSILQDNQIKLGLIQSIELKKLNQRINTIENKCKFLAFDDYRINPIINAQNDNNLENKITSEDLAYVIYTSGTSGQPKGVMIRHKGVVSLVKGTSYIELNASSSIVQLSDIAFDAATFEIYSAWLNGGKLFVPKDRFELLVDFVKLKSYLSVNSINILWLTKTLFDQLYLADKDLFENITYLLVGGEALNCFLMRELVSSIKKPLYIINGYGPTENTTFSCMYNILDTINYKYSIPIGKPLHNRSAYILSDNLIPMPIGAIGELYLGGDGLAKGYKDLPKLTLKKFLINPFICRNSKIYKTGDLARYLPDGNIEYIDRNDNQIKIRGYRVELGEIEIALNNFPEIIQSTVIVQKDITVNQGNDTRYLVAYYTAKNKLNDKDISKYLTDKLPTYMIPKIFMHLHKLPLTYSGKLNIKDLPKAEFIKNDYIQPRNEVEHKVCAIYTSILNLKSNRQVGITDDFFQLGGDSIISIQLVRALNYQLNLNLTVKNIFYNRNIKSLYDNVVAAQLQVGKTPVILTEQGKLCGAVPLLPIQQWFFSCKFSNINYWNQSFLVKVPPLDLSRLRTCVSKLISYHDIFSIRYKQNGEQYYATVPAEDLKILDVPTVNNIGEILTKWQMGFDIVNGPTYSIGYIHGYKYGGSKIFFAAHHLIIDTVSWHIIADDLRRLYHGEDLGAKGTSYRQWVNLIADYATNHKEEERYWDRILLNQRKLDYIISSHKSNLFTFNLTPQLTDKLLYHCNHFYNTRIDDLILAAFSMALRGLLKSDIIHINMEGHGRESLDYNIDITKTIGWFTIMYPVQLVVHKDIGQLIKQTKEMLRKIPNKGIGYGAIKGYIKGLPKISFNYLGQIENEIKDWTLIDECSGINAHPNNHAPNIIDAIGMISKENLKFTISAKLCLSELEQFTLSFRNYLIDIINYLSCLKRSYLTISDVNNIISQEYLDQIQQYTEIEDIYLANSLQQGFIYHALNREPIDYAYISQFMWEYKIKLDVHNIENAWKLAQKKYDSLRLRFAWDNQLVQIIDKYQKLDFRYVDLSDIIYNVDKYIFQKQQLERILVNDREEYYNLNQSNLIRIYLIKWNIAHFTCIVSMHHIISDGWSLPILIDKVHNNYLKLINSPNEEAMDDIESDHVYRNSQKYLQIYADQHKEFWEAYIKDIEDSKIDWSWALKSEVKNIDITEYRNIKQIQEQSLKIKKDIFLKLKNLCQVYGITINSIIHYVWHKLLHVYGHCEITVVGIIVSGRNIPVDNIDDAVGLLSNTLPLIVKHNDKITLIESIKSIQNTINEINSKSNINLASLQRNGERLFDSMISYENFPINMCASAKLGLKFENIISMWNVDYPIILAIEEKRKDLIIKIKYASELFDQKAITILLNKFNLLIEQIIEFPQGKILNYLTQKEYKYLLTNYNSISQKFSSDQTIQRLFEKQVNKTPDEMAMVFNNKWFTYNQLNIVSNRLAHKLIEGYNIGADDLVAICMDRNEYMVIAILAILKSGGAYMPVSSIYPKDRIRAIIKNSHPKAIITCKKYASKILVDRGIMILIDDQFEANMLSRYPALNPITSTNSYNLAYVIYTSGTTGTPKGVMMEHVGCVNRVKQMIKASKITGKKKVLFKTDYIFDVSFSDIFVTLASGGLLVITEHVFDIPEIISKIIKYDIDICHFTPSQFTIVKSTYGLSVLNRLKVIHFSGEGLNPNIINGLNYNVKCINYYGPTESGEVSYDNVLIDALDSSSLITIGHQINNVAFYVLDKNLTLVPIGAIGELYISGIALARGYINQPTLTSQKFINNPFSSLNDKCEKLYKTGDLVRACYNGSIEYLGRNDSQLKIRGFRIEPGEVEKALLEVPGITIAVVIAQNQSKDMHSAENTILVGYYVAEKKINEETIFDHLSKQLPSYMVPSAFIHLNKFPLTVNGKLNKAALPSIIASQNINNYLAPRNELEAQICSIYENILKPPSGRIGIDCDFFKSGGNSLLAIQLLVKLQQNFKVTLNDIFYLKTPAKIAQFVPPGKGYLRGILKQVKSFYVTQKDLGNSYSYLYNQKINGEQIDYLDISKNKNIINVLLSGATGYLGCNVLYQLLTHTQYQVYMVVRAMSDTHAYNRVKAKFSFYFNINLDIYNERIVVLASDLRVNNLDLGEYQYSTLVENIDSIIHCAALVKHYGHYNDFYQANVQATINLLELAKLTKVKDFHYISTIGVFMSSSLVNQNGYVFDENYKFEDFLQYNNFYLETKCHGEVISCKYREYGVNVNIYRVGNLTTNSANHLNQENISDNAFLTKLKTLLMLGKIPQEIAMAEISPVDLTALGIIKIFDKVVLSNRNYHIFNPHPNNLIDLLNSNSQSVLEVIPISDFIDDIISKLDDEAYCDRITLFMLHQLWLQNTNWEILIKLKVLQSQTSQILAWLNFKWLPITAKMLYSALQQTVTEDK